MTGPSGNSEFCFPETLNVPLGFPSRNIEGLGGANLSVSQGANRWVFCYTSQLKIERYTDVSKESRSVLLSSLKVSSKFCSLQKSLNVLTALSVALLADLERLSCRSRSITSSVLVWNRLAAMTALKLFIWRGWQANLPRLQKCMIWSRASRKFKLLFP